MRGNHGGMSSSPPDPETPGGAERDVAADQRDSDAGERDRTARGRDAGAAVRDAAADLRPQFGDAAATDRAASSQDRAASADDRRRAAQDRRAAAQDRTSAAAERSAAVFDGLTGAYRRDAGLVALERQAVEAKRTGQPLTLAFLDVIGLKATNDRAGHAAGDRLLADVARLVRSAIREYDLLVRYGGDEFLCGLLALDRSGAAERFSAAPMTAGTEPWPISIGLAELRPEDALADQIARADADMYRGRHRGPA